MEYDVIIIGGGIVGLATALRIKEANPRLKVTLLEKEDGLALHQTGNNSGVIHSGIYYKPGSLKAMNCINGYRQMVDFCHKEQVPFEICGKIIIATKQEELQRLEDLYQRGLQNGLTKIKRLTASEIVDYEPHARGIAGIWVPYTGIIDYKDVCAKFAEIFVERYHGEIYLNEKVDDIKFGSERSHVISKKNTFTAKLIVNTAGLYADRIARIN